MALLQWILIDYLIDSHCDSVAEGLRGTVCDSKVTIKELHSFKVTLEDSSIHLRKESLACHDDSIKVSVDFGGSFVLLPLVCFRSIQDF